MTNASLADLHNDNDLSPYTGPDWKKQKLAQAYPSLLNKLNACVKCCTKQTAEPFNVSV